MSWDVVIGIEVHVQLNTQSKIFSSSETTFGACANENASIIDLALPGTLPVLNRETINQAIKFALSVNAKINPVSVFERKNYFYPDLPKGYQLSQLEHPIVIGGYLTAPITNDSNNRVELNRAHLEEDAGKSIHFSHESGIDLNRAGIPLLEIVTEPCIYSIEEAISYLKQLHSLVQYLDICDGNMQEGSFRCDINISMRKKGDLNLGTRTEIKNMNSFRFIEKALNYEIDRQIDILESGGSVKQETRLYDDKKNETRSMRSKEEANDYRYFPCPDLLPVHVSLEQINQIKKTLPELPLTKLRRYQDELLLTDEEAKRLTQDKSLALYFESVLENTKAKIKTVVNWILGELLAYLNKKELSINETPVDAKQFSELLNYIHDKTLTGNIAKKVFLKMCDTQLSAEEIIKKDELAPVSNTDELTLIVEDILKANPKQVEQYQAGKEQLLGFFIGQAMQKTKGKASPQLLTQVFQEALKPINKGA